MEVPPSISLGEFLIWESKQPVETRYELLGGKIVAMGQGATQEHNQLVTNLALFIGAHRGDCRLFIGMQRVLSASDATFPDLVLTCDERDMVAEDRTSIRYPKLIIEVFSPSTAGIDLTKKLRAYETIETLEEYVVVDSRERHVIVYRRPRYERVSSGSVMLTTISATLDIDALYEGIVDAENGR